MGSTRAYNYEIKKFDGKKFASWMEMMQDILVQRY